MQPTPGLRDAGLDAVIGMYPTVHRLRTTVVTPWAASALGDAAVRPPQRVLIYGPPGCGTTFIARRLCDDLSMSADVAGVVIDAVDEVAERDPDELDALLDARATRDVVLVGTAHRPWALGGRFLTGPASERPAFERLAFVPPPDWDARRFRLWETPFGSGLDVADLDQLVIATERWSGADLAALAGAGSTAAELLAAIAERTPTSADWLSSARDMIRSLDSYGRVDDLVGYLQRYRLL